MFEWMSKRGVNRLGCRMCKSSLPPRYFEDHGEHDPRTYVCLSCRLVEDPPENNTLWKECHFEVVADLTKVRLKIRAGRL